MLTPTSPLVVAALLLVPAFAVAGPLNPPAGAISSTAKTLVEVEPRTAISSTNTPGDADSQFRITAPGSYYLTGNIAGVANRKAIEVQDFLQENLQKIPKGSVMRSLPDTPKAAAEPSTRSTSSSALDLLLEDPLEDILGR